MFRILASRRTRKNRPSRPFRLEILEGRAMLNASPVSLASSMVVPPAQLAPAIAAAVQSAAPKTQAQAADRVFNVNVQLGGGILSQIMNLTSELHNVEGAVDSVLAEIPGWHLQADVDKVPQFSGHVTGTIDEAANGALKSASLSVSLTADAAATVEGYYGISLVHVVGLGVTADVTANVTASASYSAGHGWTFGGSAKLAASVTGFAESTAAAWKGSLYAQASLTSTMYVGSSGMVTGNTVLSGSVGADIEQYNLAKKEWDPILTDSFSLGQKSFLSYSFDAVTIFQDAVNAAMPGGGIFV
jgi:hypothetical protein